MPRAPLEHRSTTRTHAWRFTRTAMPGRRGRSAPACPTHDALERWTAERLGSLAHERRVTELATDLFEVTRPLHGLGADDLRLLRWAAVVHDVGRSVCAETHPRDGARLLRADRTLPLSKPARRHLVYLTRYHRGDVPVAGRDAVLRRTDKHTRLRAVLALLRAADALDSRSLAGRDEAPPRVVFGLTVGPLGEPRLAVTCAVGSESAKAVRVYGRRKKFRLIEEALGCAVDLQVVEGKRSRAAA